MKVILYAAVSADGFIAKLDGDSDWVSEVDTGNWEKEIQEVGGVIIGRKTFDQFYKEIYPVKDVINIVLTSNNNLKPKDKNVYYVPDAKNAIKVAENQGLKSVILTGGAKVNATFLKVNYIDEIILTVHPLILGYGINIFDNVESELELELLNSKRLDEGIIRLHFKIKK